VWHRPGAEPSPDTEAVETEAAETEAEETEAAKQGDADASDPIALAMAELGDAGGRD
jgi:hypothetical protein